MTRPAIPARDLMPASALPLAYYVFAHGCLLLALVVLVTHPSLPAGAFYQPRFAALVHLLTLGWITGSIIGSFYIVGPLALGIPMKTGSADWTGYASFAVGTCAAALGFWSGRYDGVSAGGAGVTLAVAWVGARAARGFAAASAPAGVLLHVGLAFLNMLGAAALGILVALDRSRGFLGLSPLAVTFTHAHIAAVGFATMMVVGLAYRLIPMMLPSAMPAGPRLMVSALALESGLVVLAGALLRGSAWTSAAWALIVVGLVSFSQVMRGSVGRRMPRPPALPSRDWSTWQAHAALLWLAAAVTIGGLLSAGVWPGGRLQMMWLYGVAGLVGFLAQIVTGIQGRLFPFYAWYRAFAALGRPPGTAANALPSARYAKAIFFSWSASLPVLAAGLAFDVPLLVSAGASGLALGVVAGLAYLRHMLRAARHV
jgi:hypothetical protein